MSYVDPNYPTKKKFREAVSAGVKHRGHQHRAVGLRDPCAGYDVIVLIGSPKLVARGQDPDRRLLENSCLLDSKSGQQPDASRCHNLTSPEDHVTDPHVLPGGAEMPSRITAPYDLYGAHVGFCIGVLDPDDAVGTLRYGRPCHHTHGLPRADWTARGFARVDDACDAESDRRRRPGRRHVLGPDGVPVHRTVDPGGKRSAAANVLSEGPP